MHIKSIFIGSSVSVECAKTKCVNEKQPQKRTITHNQQHTQTFWRQKARTRRERIIIQTKREKKIVLFICYHFRLCVRLFSTIVSVVSSHMLIYPLPQSFCVRRILGFAILLSSFVRLLYCSSSSFSSFRFCFCVA